MKTKPEWYQKVLKENKKEVVSSMIFFLLFALTFLLWHFFSGGDFMWVNVEPISEPELPYRLLYSALVFVTLGAVLYKIKFYRFLHVLTVGVLGDWKLYKDLKGLIWLGLMLLMYFFIVPWVVHLLNAIISFFYNVFNLILYLFPPLGIAGILFTVGYFITKRVDPVILK